MKIPLPTLIIPLPLSILGVLSSFETNLINTPPFLTLAFSRSLSQASSLAHFILMLLLLSFLEKKERERPREN